MIASDINSVTFIKALDLACFLTFVDYVCQGSGTQEFIAASRPLFESISRVRPKATRKASREFYIVCKGRVMVP